MGVREVWTDFPPHLLIRIEGGWILLLSTIRDGRLKIPFRPMKIDGMEKEDKSYSTSSPPPPPPPQI